MRDRFLRKTSLSFPRRLSWSHQSWYRKIPDHVRFVKSFVYRPGRKHIAGYRLAVAVVAARSYSSNAIILSRDLMLIGIRRHTGRRQRLDHSLRVRDRILLGTRLSLGLRSCLCRIVFPQRSPRPDLF